MLSLCLMRCYHPKPFEKENIGYCVAVDLISLLAYQKQAEPYS